MRALHTQAVCFQSAEDIDDVSTGHRCTQPPLHASPSRQPSRTAQRSAAATTRARWTQRACGRALKGSASKGRLIHCLSTCSQACADRCALSSLSSFHGIHHTQGVTVLQPENKRISGPGKCLARTRLATWGGAHANAAARSACAILFHIWAVLRTVLTIKYYPQRHLR